MNSESQTTAQFTDSWKTGKYIIDAGFFKNDTVTMDCMLSFINMFVVALRM